MLRSEALTSLRSLPACLKAFAIFWLALAVYWQWLAHSDGIFGEMWDTLPAFRQLGALSASEIAQELLRKYALVHILAVPKLGFWIDFAWFGASGRFIRAASFLVSFACAWCMWRIALRDFQRPVACTVLALLLFFNPLQTYVINWESLLQYYLSVWFALLAYIAHWQSPRRVWLSCVLLLLSAFSCGSGIAAIAGFSWLLLVLWWEGKKISTAAAVSYVVFVLLMACLLIPEKNNSVLLQQPNPFFWQAPNLLLQYLAFPFSAWGDCRWLGVLILLSFAHSVWRCIMRRAGNLSDHVLILFFGIACVIAIGRYRWMGLDADVSRYYVYIAPLWFFSALKLLQIQNSFSKGVVVIIVGGVLSASVAAWVVLGDYANKMELAKVVALNGNFRHLAGLREDALQSLPATLENSHAYLREQNMDIYYQLKPAVIPTEVVCNAHIERKTLISKKMFVDYILQETDSAVRIKKIYLTDNDNIVRYYGTAFLAATHVSGWSMPLSAARWRDWSLLLPAQWLPSAQRRLFVHLPATVNPADLQWWGEDGRGQVCRLAFAVSLNGFHADANAARIASITAL
ncbi:MAG TPA: hypothetical protein PLH12_02860 [Pseudomonadales bacterium]|nr:hypothetical protein [Pseudomonadales bacterium]